MENKLIKPIIKVHTTKYRKIDLPERMSLDLAEFVGMHFGDGGIHVRKRKSYTINYSFNIKEIQLITDFKSLFQRLFGINIKQYERNNALEFYCCSKMLAYFLNQNFDAPLGRKDYLKISIIIQNNDEYLKAFLLGLFKTDGCCFIKRVGKYEYPIIKITTKCKDFAEEIKESLNKWGFRAKINVKWGRNYYGYDIVLHGKEQLAKWNKEIIRIKDGAAGTFS